VRVCSLTYPTCKAHMRRIILSSLVYLVVPYYSTLSGRTILFHIIWLYHIPHYLVVPYYSTLSGRTILFHIISQTAQFTEQVTQHKMRVLIFSTNLSETFPIIRRTELDIVINVHRSHCKVPITLVRF